MEPIATSEQTKVEQLARIGATEEDIALDLDIPLEHLQEFYRRELDRGRVQGRHAVLERLYTNATSDSNSTATSMWVKSQCGWRDTGGSTNSGVILQPILEVVTRGDDNTTDQV